MLFPWTSERPLAWSPTTSFSQNCKDMDLVGGQRVVGGQWVNVQMEISDKWCPSGIGGETDTL